MAAHKKIHIQEAMLDLIGTVGLACGGKKDACHTSMGASICGANTVFTQSETSKSRALAVNEEQVPGGDIVITLQGESQPEGARVLDDVIGEALKKAGIPPKRGADDIIIGRRHATSEHNGTGRRITFSVPDENAEKFAREVTKLAHIIRHVGGLKRQCHAGVEFSTSMVNEIKGFTVSGQIKKEAVKPFVLLNIPTAPAGREDQALAELPHFYLHMKGVPEKLAVRLAGMMSKTLGKSDESKSRRGRDTKEEYVGGYDISIPLDAPNVKQMLAEISQFVRVQDSFLKAPKELPGEGKKPPSGVSNAPAMR